MNDELKKLCDLIKNTRELGIPVQEEVIRRTIPLLHDEIIKALNEEIVPLLETIGLPFTARIQFSPEKPLTVFPNFPRHLRDSMNVVSPDKEITIRHTMHALKPQTGIRTTREYSQEEKEFMRKRNMTNLSQRSTFSVTFPDGTVIRENSDVSTFIETLKKIGLKRIYESNCQTFSGYKLVDVRGREGSDMAQRYVDGYYVYVRTSNTQSRIDSLYRISELLGEKLEIRDNNNEIVYGTEAQRRRRTGLRVTFDDGTVIEEVTAVSTFVETIKKIGLQRVCDTGVRIHGIRVVSPTADPRYPEYSIPTDGYYVAGVGDNAEKARALERIAERLQINIVLQIVDPN